MSSENVAPGSDLNHCRNFSLVPLKFVESILFVGKLMRGKNCCFGRLDCKTFFCDVYPVQKWQPRLSTTAGTISSEPYK
jgi:hypothetical protein